MATIGLSVAGTAIAGPAGGIVGATIGRYIDQAVFASIFPPDDIEGSRVGDLKLSSAEEGAAVNYPIGTNFRVPGNVIWISPVRKEITSTTTGKYAPTVTNEVARVDLAIEFAGREISEITKIWANW